MSACKKMSQDKPTGSKVAGGRVQHHHVEDVPVQLSPKGVMSMISPMLGPGQIKKPGIIMLYKKGCPWCDRVYQHGVPKLPLNRLAKKCHADGSAIVAVANGPRLIDQLPGEMDTKTYPAIFVVGIDDTVVRYQHTDRSFESMLNAIMAVSGTQDEEFLQDQSKWADVIQDHEDDVFYATGSKIDGEEQTEKAPATIRKLPARLKDVEAAKNFAARDMRKIIVIDDGVDKTSEKFVSELVAAGVQAVAIDNKLAEQFMNKEMMNMITYLPMVIFVDFDSSARALLSISESFSKDIGNIKKSVYDTVNILKDI